MKIQENNVAFTAAVINKLAGKVLLSDDSVAKLINDGDFVRYFENGRMSNFTVDGNTTITASLKTEQGDINILIVTTAKTKTQTFMLKLNNVSVYTITPRYTFAERRPVKEGEENKPQMADHIKELISAFSWF